MLNVILALILGILVGLIVGLLLGIVGTMLGLRTLNTLKRKEHQKKKPDSVDTTANDINFLYSKFKDVG